MALTEHQQLVHDDGMNILRSSDRLLIKGSAGVGKTYLADQLISSFNKAYPHRWKEILCAAPTNKAVAVLKGKVGSHDNVKFSTIHSALKIKRKVNRSTGVITFEPSFNSKYPPFKDLKLLIIDEASMIGIELLKHIEEYATRFNVKVIFLGDDKQLNPVKEKDSPVFLGKPHYFKNIEEARKYSDLEKNISREYANDIVVFEPYPDVELTEIVRQGDGNPIIDLSRNINMVWDKVEIINMDSDQEAHGFTYTEDRNRIINALAEVNGTDELKYLAWTNKEVDEMNRLVRQKIYGTPSKIEQSETLVFNSPFKDKYFTNEEITVHTLKVVQETRDVIVKRNPITEEEISVSVTLSLYVINEADEGGVKVIHEDSEQEYKNIERMMHSNCRARLFPWLDYFKFTESFGDLKYNHAITVHKSQGSSYKKSIVNVGNLALNKDVVEKVRLFYTAVTRASNLLILYNI